MANSYTSTPVVGVRRIVKHSKYARSCSCWSCTQIVQLSNSVYVTHCLVFRTFRTKWTGENNLPLRILTLTSQDTTNGASPLASVPIIVSENANRAIADKSSRFGSTAWCFRRHGYMRYCFAVPLVSRKINVRLVQSGDLCNRRRAGDRLPLALQSQLFGPLRCNLRLTSSVDRPLDGSGSYCSTRSIQPRSGISLLIPVLLSVASGSQLPAFHHPMLPSQFRSSV